MVRRMKPEKSLFIILIFTLTLAWNISTVYAEQYTPLLKVSAGDVYLTAGEENNIAIMLKNTGDFEVYEVKAVLSVPTTMSGISIIGGAHKIFNEIGEEEEKTYYPLLYVDRSVPLGAYTLSLQVDYLKRYKLGYTQFESAMVQIGIVVENVTKTQIWLGVGMEELKLETGSEDEAKIRIENIGDVPVFDVDVTVTSTSPYVVVTEGAKFTKDILETGENAILKPTLAVSKNALLGVYTLDTSVSYVDGDGRKYLDSFTLGFSIDFIQISDQTSIVLKNYETNLETIRPGDIFNLNFELECLGAMAHDVKTSLSLDLSTGIAPLSPTLISAGDLEPGQIEEMKYKLLVGGEVRAGQYPARLTISYLDVDGVPRSLTETVTISIRGIVEFSLINLDPIEASGGMVTEFEADLLLIGTENIQFVQIEMVEDDAFRRTSGSVEYIGAVDPDSPIPFDIEFEVAGDAEAGDHNMMLQVNYTDDLNMEHVTKIKIPITVTEASANEKTSQGLIGSFWIWLRRLLGLLP